MMNMNLNFTMQGKNDGHETTLDRSWIRKIVSPVGGAGGGNDDDDDGEEEEEEQEAMARTGSC